NINSIGCPNCRPKYHEKLKEYFAQHIDGMCEDCKARFEKNPLRLLDCKEEKCSAIAKNAPVVIEHLCDECHDHFEGLKKTLDAMGVDYQINTKIVRGLDYYTKTVFEFVYDGIGSQGTVCGGGRYDGLFEELGGNHVPAVGFGMGLERLLLTLEAEGISLGEDSVPEIFFANIGEAAKVYAFTLAEKARAEGMRAQSDLMGRSLKAQMKYADKIKAIYTVVLGDDEVANQSAVAKNMLTKEQITLDLTKPIREQLK
ncbi:MAG: histidine--tRNA ligase, partial [Oscillospiraceae bacterium]|nr:histidine--tRNA ligase [Oscillospiraceae bacterium]